MRRRRVAAPRRPAAACCSPAATRHCRPSRRSRSRCAPSAASRRSTSPASFLVPEPTIGQRISRAKAKIAQGAHPVPRSRRARAARPAAGRPRRDLPRVHRRAIMRRPARLVACRPRRRGDPARADDRRTDARRGRVRRIAGADAGDRTHGGAPGPTARASDPARRSGSVRWDRAAIAEAAAIVESVPAPWTRRAVSDPGGDRLPPRARDDVCRHRLARRSPSSTGCSRSAGRRRWCGSTASVAVAETDGTRRPRSLCSTSSMAPGRTVAPVLVDAGRLPTPPRRPLRGSRPRTEPRSTARATTPTAGFLQRRLAEVTQLP